MDQSSRRIRGSRDEDINNDERRSSYNRLTSAQTARLEDFMKEYNHPNDAQRQQLAEELGLQPKQIKFWFQNKRTLLKNQYERQNNNNLRIENETIRNENLLMKEALKVTACAPCGGPPFPREDHEQYMHKMQRENAQIKEECEKKSKLLTSFMERKISQPMFEHTFNSIDAFSSNNDLENPPMVYGRSTHVHGLSNLTVREAMLVNRSTLNYDEENMISQLAILAMQELVRLVRTNEPFWINISNTHQDGRYTLDHESYYQVFPKNNHIRGDNVSEESSKYSGIVRIDGMKLVDLFLDSDKWRNLFPTIVTKAETTKVFELGLSENRDGALLLMNEEMHILSPLVRPREFNIIRYCKQVAVGVWMITDVSFDSTRPNTSHLSCSWKHPSGCIIYEMPNKSCMVTWIEHVEVEDMVHTHRMFRDFVANNNLYGAESWIKELQRMCERYFNFYAEVIPSQESIGVIQTIEGRRSVMKLAHRMVKIFSECLTMAGQLEFQHLNLDSSIGGVRVSLRQASIDQPNGIIVVAATTLWLPLPAEYVFEFLKDPTKRYQWDVMACGNPMYEISHISNGLYHGNCTSIFQQYIPYENNIMILQESFTSSVGSYVIYAPIDTLSMNATIWGEDSTKLQILPTGFVVCPYAQPNATFEAFNNIGSSSSGGVGSVRVGTLLTLAYQILTCSPNGIDQHQNMEAIATINTLLSTTVLKVRGALMNSN
ncbi:hypothetical protein TSUD_376760 [Trifolium subterraneum]|uniref:Homeobox domain-containing protein n=1 Tax=Trifolium subterraneum TaxID=3900 RepID=A0A2Z6MI78_TRISU|nr:hypothetical protein TSUD_376760 [Trifolium subterraneum]